MGCGTKNKAGPGDLGWGGGCDRRPEWTHFPPVVASLGFSISLQEFRIGTRKRGR